MEYDHIIIENAPACDSTRNSIKNNQIQVIGHIDTKKYISHINLGLKTKTSLKYSKIDLDDYKFIKDKIWGFHNCGYSHHVYRTNKKNTRIYLHRYILEQNGFDLSEKEVDHINGDRLDNRKCNLRIVTEQQNRYNLSKRSGNCTSKYKGVSYDKSRNKWKSTVCHNKKAYNRRFKTEKEAAESYNEMATKLFGQYAKLNNIYE